MDSEVKEAIVIAIELLVFSVLVAIIFVFSQYSREAYNFKHTSDISINAISEYRDIYQFSHGAQILKKDIISVYNDADFFYDNNFNDRYIEAKLGVVPIFRYINSDDKKEILRETEDRVIRQLDYNIVTGDDIIRFIGLYPYSYNVRIIKDITSDSADGSAFLFKNLPENLISQFDSTVNDKDIYYIYKESLKIGRHFDFNVSELNEWMGELTTQEFYSLFIFDDYNNIYDSIIFVLKSVD